MTHGCECEGTSGEISRQIMRLQVVTLIWMVVECALALFSAWRARSPVLLAFGADSLIELLCLPCRHNPRRLLPQALGCGVSTLITAPGCSDRLCRVKTRKRLKVAPDRFCLLSAGLAFPG